MSGLGGVASEWDAVAPALARHGDAVVVELTPPAGHRIDGGEGGPFQAVSKRSSGCAARLLVIPPGNSPCSHTPDISPIAMMRRPGSRRSIRG